MLQGHARRGGERGKARAHLPPRYHGFRFSRLGASLDFARSGVNLRRGLQGVRNGVARGPVRLLALARSLSGKVFFFSRTPSELYNLRPFHVIFDVFHFPLHSPRKRLGLEAAKGLRLSG